MNFHFILNTLVFSAIAIVPTMVSADQMVRFIFNNGIEPTTTACNPTENAMIDALFLPKTGRRRRLRHLRTSNETYSRGLSTYAAVCKQNCLGLKCCRATGCLGYDGSINKNRDLLSVCDNILLDINRKLDALPVSTSCKSYLAASKRKAECYNDVRYGEVLGAKLWTITSSGQTSQDLPFSGFSFCKSKSINIEGIVNDCVDVLDLDLSGPNGYIYGRYENNIPYSMFGDDGVKFAGRVLPYVGAYKLVIRPDAYNEKQKTITFTVNNC
jgi:hypothetical protein